MPAILNNLGIAFQSRFECLGDVSDLTEAISIKQRAVQLTPSIHPDMPMRLNNLGMSFQSRFEHTGDISDLTEAISTKQRAVQLTPSGHPNMPICLSNLGISFQSRFGCTGNVPDLVEAVSMLQQAVQLTPDGHPGMSVRLNNLGAAFQIRFEYTGDVSDLTEAISIQHRAVQLAPNGHPDRPIRLHNLGMSLQSRFGRIGDVSDLTEAISIQQQVVQLTSDGHPDMPMRLHNLGASFQSRFEHTGDVSDIIEAISIQQRAVRLVPDGHPSMPMRLSNLGVSFQSYFGRTGKVSDLTEAISTQQRAVQLTPNGHPDRPIWLHNLGMSLQSRFEHTGNVSDLTEAISNQQRAVQLTPDGHPGMPMRLHNLGMSFQTRFERTGDVTDLMEAISIQQRAIQLCPDGHRDIPAMLNNLGITFQSRFGRTDDVADLTEAISTQQRAVQLTPDGYPDMPMRLHNLGMSFQNRFGRTGNISDILEAISIQQRAIRLTPNGHSDMPTMLNNLGMSFQSRFGRTGDVADLTEAISIQQRAVQLTPDGHSDMPMRLNNLAISFRSRFEHTDDLSDILTATLTSQKSATALGTPSVRLKAAQMWAELSMIADNSQCLTAFGTAINLISEIVGMDSTIEQRQTYLMEISSLTTSAASAAFTFGDVQKALEWLEQGRCLVWTQLNQLRTPLDHLRAHDQHLAQRFSDISRALDASGSRPGSKALHVDATLLEKISLQDEARLQIKLSREWSQLLDEIRRIPEFRNFLRPPLASDLLKHLPRNSIAILVNVHKDRCDALALISSSDTPVHIPLDFTHDEASKLREHMRHFLSSHGVRMRGADRAGRAVRDYDAEKQSEIHFVLKVLWLRVVRPILDGLAFSVSFSHFMVNHFINILLQFESTPPSDPVRIWWCPTGPLTFLPLHAAGMYSRNGRSPPGSCISDFAISSYTPNISSLLQKLKESAHVQEPASSKLLIISQPNTPGCLPIPETTKEMNCIWNVIETYNGESLRLEGESASVNRVKVEMESHGSIHLACHASQDLEHSLKSGFYLDDGRLELSEIMKQKFAVRELAFLSACQTSAGDEKLSEEAVHLAAGMLAAGYRSVVATMWSIKDQYGPVVAESFYEDLMERGKIFGKPGIDSNGAAHALHHAIRGIRDALGDSEKGLLTWVPYVHFGC